MSCLKIKTPPNNMNVIKRIMIDQLRLILNEYEENLTGNYYSKNMKKR